ncbi:MAG: N-acetylmuramoyl-L-alanine amidase [Eubacteriales bacterium]|nr:N-acetylmuramoyl-L-alanine amidase [Eubacteriales bacterium]
MREEKTGIRWDKVIGLITIVAILVLAAMITMDFRPNEMTEHNSSGEEKQEQLLENENVSSSVEKKVTVCIDAGHGGTDTGFKSGGVYEKTQTLIMAQKVQKALESRNVSVVMTRTADVSVSDEERVRICNEADSAAIVSIHRNYYEGTANVYGAEAWIHTLAPEDSKSLAGGILVNLQKSADEDNRGVKTGTAADSTRDYYINQKSKCASCVLELGFISSPADNALVTTNSDAAAKAIADGILEYLKTMGYING